MPTRVTAVVLASLSLMAAQNFEVLGAECEAYLHYHPLMSDEERESVDQMLAREMAAGCGKQATGIGGELLNHPLMSEAEFNAAADQDKATLNALRAEPDLIFPSDHPLMTEQEFQDYARELEIVRQQRCAQVGCPPPLEMHPLMTDQERTEAYQRDKHALSQRLEKKNAATLVSTPMSSAEKAFWDRIHPLMTDQEVRDLAREISNAGK